jgi:NAD(P)-dependent dehydrogenase (short-subunit alcohol dehydrogenase family)
MGKLQGKVALVTGSGRGLGRAYALRLAGLGADVVINDVDLESAKQYSEGLTAATVMDEVRQLGRRSLGVQADVSKAEEAATVLDLTLDEFGRLDILVNNAGGGLSPPGDPTEEERFRFVMDINLMSAVHCCQAASEPMKAQGSGKIVNISSLCGLTGTEGGASYSIAKAGIAHYTRVLAAQLGPHGVNVNCIAPGYILSSRKIAEGMGGPGDGSSERIPLRRHGTPEDCARVVEFLATDLSDYVTGQCISVCGGLAI